MRHSQVCIWILKKFFCNDTNLLRQEGDMHVQLDENKCEKMHIYIST